MEARVRGTLGIVVLITAAGAGSARCGPPPSSSAPGAAATASAPAQAAPQAGRRNACALVDREEIARLVGQKISMLHNIEDEDQSTCEVSYADTSQVFLYVEAHWKGGRELAQAEKAGLAMAKRQMKEDEDADIEELTGSGSVKGLADDAYYSDIMPSWVLKGDVLVKFTSPLFAHDLTSKIFFTQAAKALSRL